MDSRFADDTAVRLTYETYEKFQPKFLTADKQLPWLNYSIPQLFYLSLAQKFCEPLTNGHEMATRLVADGILPSYFRVNSMLMNSKQFAEAYECPDGSTMNPSFKVDQFPYLADLHVDYFETKFYDDN